MQSANKDSISVGKISSGLTGGDLIKKTLSFVHQQLPLWRDDPHRAKESSENKLNLQLCNYLNSKAMSIFPMLRFNHEEYQSGRSAADISASVSENRTIGAKAYSIYDPILILECKRLPAPSAERKIEYVTGGNKKNGGIQRFKLGIYSSKINVAALIGYIQTDTAQQWHKNINKWILELQKGSISDISKWEEDERLKNITVDTKSGVSICHSVHKRGRLKTVTIYHMWVLMRA